MYSQFQYAASVDSSANQAHLGLRRALPASQVVVVVCFLMVTITGISASTAAPPICTEPFCIFPTNPADFVHPILRPINLLPESPLKVNTSFYFYSKWLQANSSKSNGKLSKSCHTVSLQLDQSYTPCIFTTENLLDTGRLGAELKEVNQLKPGKSAGWTAVVVHGFLDSLHGSSSWMSTIKNALLATASERSYDVVVLTDWTGGNGIPYLQATANTRLVGAQIAYFLQQLKLHLNLDIEKTHIIGHSLGCHIAGYAGERFISPKLGQITALDPAGPNFEGLPKSVRLDQSDAAFVDVIHTNGKPLYRLGYVGHIDFYPNGGLDQPGCDISALPGAFNRLMRNPDNLLAGIGQIGELVTCSHLRAIDYFVESITASECHFSSVQCAWVEFLEGTCPPCNNTAPNTPQCAQMGFRVFKWARQMASARVDAKDSTKFYLETNWKAPFCKQ